VAIGWAYLLVFQELHRRNSGGTSARPAAKTSKVLADLRSLAEQAFDAPLFLQQAGAAYEFILTRYAAGDMEKLAGLLDAEVFEAFSAETTRRVSAGETMTLEFVALETCKIVDAEFDELEAAIRVRFESELFLSEGREAAEGDTTATTLLRAIDIWTFRREHSSNSPVWTLAATDSE
jgi:predicted lipid-binding transport protein (Tim44 family)